VPSVAGEVIDVPVMPNEPLKAGDVLFRIDPTPYEAQLRGLDAQLKLAELRLGQMTAPQAGVARVQRPAASGRGRSAQGAGRCGAVESRQDNGACAG
jgi:multidrug resistance efflux pump